MNFGLYIHIPFCSKKCKYCDFVSVSGRDNDEISDYVDCLIAEIRSYGDKMRNNFLNTVYIGGGTPSYIESKHVIRIMSAIGETFNCNISEATIECNPDSVSLEKLADYKSAGLNRISMGVQSFNDNLLHILGRIHDKNTAIQSINNAKLYFDNISIDLMIGLPTQQMNDIIDSLIIAVNSGINHISVYGLTIEKGTPFYEMAENDMIYVNEDLAADMYDYTYKFLKTKGFYRYEISNFAQKGFESKHNLSYWHRLPYIGVGTAAYGFLDGNRYNNYKHNYSYMQKIKKGESPIDNVEKLTLKDAMTETVMLSLRTAEGLDLGKYNSDFNCDFLSEKSAAIKKNIDFIDINNNYLTIKPKYYYISNAILSDLI